MGSAIAVACACAAWASRGDELAEPPAPRIEQVQVEPSAARGSEVASRNLGPQDGSWLVSYTAVYSSFDGDVIGVPVYHRLGVKYLWDRLRLGIDLVGGNSARFIAGVSPGVQLESRSAFEGGGSTATWRP